MSNGRRSGEGVGRRGVRIALVALAVGALVASACTSKGTSDTKEGGGGSAAEVDPMAAVNDSVTFHTEVEARKGVSWLEAAGETARWDFRKFPDQLTDLVVRTRVVVPSLAVVDGAATVSVAYGQGEDQIGTQDVTLPVAGPAGSSEQVRASGSFVIPAGDLPDRVSRLWVRAVGAADHPVGVQVGSVSFHPLRLATGVDKGDDIPLTAEDGAGTTSTSIASAPTTPSTAPTPTTSGGAPVPVAGSFTSNGDQISGWWWLRDSAGAHQARWTFPSIPTGSADLGLDFSMLATDQVNGGPGVDARFYVTWGFTGAGGGAVGVGGTKLVELDNVSPESDPVGYTNEGSTTIPRSSVPSTATGLWVQATRKDPTGAGAPTTEHVAFNADALTLTAGSGGGGGSTTSSSTSTSSSTTTTTGGGGTGGTGGGGSNGDCTTGAITAASFASSGKRMGQVVTSAQPGWYWLPRFAMPHANRYYDRSESRAASGTWRFTTRPAGGGRIQISVPVDWAAGGTAPPAAVYVTYGVITPGGGTGVKRTAKVTLQVAASTGTITGFKGTGDLTLPQDDLSGSISGYWVRLSLGDPRGDRPAISGAGLGVAQPSVTICGTSSSTTDLSGASGGAANVTAAWDGTHHAIDASASIFTDPATDIDGDGLNQDFEDAAMEKANPVVELDEEDMWLHYFDEHPTFHVAEATLWPSYAHPTHVVIAYLSTWAYDDGGGLQQPANIVSENHRGDSERIFTGWRIEGDDRIVLDWVNTSAHHSINDHSAVWKVGDRQCNVANVAKVLPRMGVPPWSAEAGTTEVMCATPEFDGSGRLVMYTSENKHAMYPTATLCNAVDLARLPNGTSAYGENCGWDPWGLGQWTDDDFDSDPQYLGSGRWRFDAYNVGEPGYPLIDDLDNSAGWQRVSDADTAALVGKFMGEAVWSGRYENTDQCRGSTCFCGGFDVGDEIALDFREDLEMPDKCSGRLGTKFEEWTDLFTGAMDSRYRVVLRTGDVDGAGTDERVSIELRTADTSTVASKGYEGDLERNATDVVYLPVVGRDADRVLLDPEVMPGVRITRVTGNNDRNPRWYLHQVEVKDLETGDTRTFTVDRWIDAGSGGAWTSN